MIASSQSFCPVAEAESLRDYSLEIFERIEHIQEVRWNNHVPESNVLMQHESLAMLQHLHGDQMQFRYVLVKRNEVTVGAFYFQVVMFHANQLINYFPAFSPSNYFMKGLKAATKKLLDAINLKMLVSGNVFMTGENGFYFSGDVDKATRAKILRKTINEILRKNSEIKAVLISDLYEPKTEFDTDFKRCGYNEITVESDMSIQLRSEWKNFDDYLAALSSKYRVRAKKVFSLCHENNVIGRELSLSETEQHLDRLNELYQKVMSHADFKLAELDKRFFVEQKKNLPDNYHVFAYFKDDVMIGFISLFNFGKRMEVHYTGMDAEQCKPLHLYQHMMYDMVKQGIEKRANRLHFGRTAPEIKSTIGATPSPMYGYLKHVNPVFNLLVAKPYTASLKPKHYIFRNPFKA